MAKKKQVRVQTEKSQGPWNRTKKQSKKDDLYRRMANRIVELEAHIARLATGNTGKVELGVFLTTNVVEMLEAYSASGFWGMNAAETAAMMLTERVRMEEIGTSGGGYR